MSTEPTPMRVAVTGASGLLGRALLTQLASRGHRVIAGVHRVPVPTVGNTVISPLNLLERDSVQSWIDTTKPQIIVHTAAWTDVDGCEGEVALAQALNVEATCRLVESVLAIDPGIRIVYLSTDYLFDGCNGPYDEDALPSPLNVYGRTKLEGERLVLDSGRQHASVRSASFLGVGSEGHLTFAESMLAVMRDRPPLTVAIDQRSNLTPVGYLARAITEILESGHAGIWHAAGAEIVTRHDLAMSIAKVFALPVENVRGVPYSRLQRPAERPLNGGLVSRRSLSAKCPSITDALRQWKSDLIAAGCWHDS